MKSSNRKRRWPAEIMGMANIELDFKHGPHF